MSTLILGASINPTRYSYLATSRLIDIGEQVIPFGVKAGEINGQEIHTSWNENWSIDTVTLYINAKILPEYFEKILKTEPKRIIFNPGTEHSQLMSEFRTAGIEVIEACTLVMISTDQYSFSDK